MPALASADGAEDGDEGREGRVDGLQVAAEEEVSLIDPLAGFDVRPFWKLVNDERIEKVVHAGLEDLALCFNQTGHPPRRVFDVQIAAGLVGLKGLRSVGGIRVSLYNAMPLEGAQAFRDFMKEFMSKA